MQYREELVQNITVLVVMIWESSIKTLWRVALNCVPNETAKQKFMHFARLIFVCFSTLYIFYSPT